MTENSADGQGFDTIIDRRETDSLKWRRYADPEVLPMWVADMDFASPPEVIEALRARADHGVFGYSLPPAPLVEQVVAMLKRDFDWTVATDWIVWLPGLVPALNLACRAVGRPGDEVLTLVPVYPPFLTAPGHFRRKRSEVPLALSNGRWFFDPARMDSAVTERTRLFLLCNPHNPVGRAFDREELLELGRLCRKRDLVVCADEIHCGLILDSDRRHIPFATLSPDAAGRTITLMAPSKTFNIPGLGCAFAVIADPGLRRAFRRAMAGIVPEVTCTGYAATLAAYRHGEPWRRALIDYLRANRDAVQRAVDATAGLHMARVEATYLAWIDTRETGIENPAAFFESHGVGLSDGAEFAGPGFVRLNFGCPRSRLDRALDRMVRALGAGGDP